MKRLNTTILLIIAVVCVAAGLIVLGPVTFPEKSTGPLEQMTIGTALNDQSGLIWIAEQRGYFAENGGSATIKLFQTGKDAASALLGGNVDVATASEFVVVANAVREEKIGILGSICKTDGRYLLAMEDQSRWMIGSEQATHFKMPYYPSHVYWHSLQKVNPASVTMIR